MQQCATCQYFQHLDKKIEYGTCLRYPTPIRNKHRVDGCGEHKPIQIDTKIKEPGKKH